MPFIPRAELEHLSDAVVTKTEEVAKLAETLDTEVAKHYETRDQVYNLEFERDALQVKVVDERNAHAAIQRAAGEQNRLFQQELTNQARQTQKLETFLENLLTLEPSLKRFLAKDQPFNWSEALQLITDPRAPKSPRKPVWDFEAVTRVIGLQAAKKAAAADEALTERLSKPAHHAEIRFFTPRDGFNPEKPTVADLNGGHIVRGGHFGEDWKVGDRVEVQTVTIPDADIKAAVADLVGRATSKANHPAGKGRASKKSTTKSSKKAAA